MPELLDIYDENLAHMGVKERRVVHRTGDWHRVFHCWITYRGADGRDYLVVQRRAPNKDTFPDLLDVTAAGHYAAGETMRDGVREIREELGIEVAYEDLIPLGMKVDVARFGDLIDHEFTDVFLLIHNRDLQDYHIQPEEVSGLAALDIDETIRLIRGQTSVVQARAVGLDADVIAVRLADFVPRRDAYVYKILLLAQRCLNGETHHLAI